MTPSPSSGQGAGDEMKEALERLHTTDLDTPQAQGDTHLAESGAKAGEVASTDPKDPGDKPADDAALAKAHKKEAYRKAHARWMRYSRSLSSQCLRFHMWDSQLYNIW